MRTFLILIFYALSNVCFGQSILDGIADSLKENCNEIIVSDNTQFEIIDINNSIESRQYTAIILNDRASETNNVVLHYSDFREIKDALVQIFDINGNALEKYRLKDFDDYSSIGSSIGGDDRYKYIHVVSSKYPYMIKVDYSVKYTGSMFYPTWVPQGDEKVSVLAASLRVRSGLDGGFRHKSLNIEPTNESNIGGITEVYWKVENLKTFEFEQYARSFAMYTPVVYTAPIHFQMDGLTGKMDTWENLGKWQAQLISSQNTLTPEQVKPILDQLDSNATDLQKVKFAYDYLQKNTRYVSIQLGIGGWQPFESGFVHEKQYGDCKALSFYTKSLLDTLGVKSYYTLINAGYRPSKSIYPDFPSRVFNHVILTVPMESDTIWLECTSQTNPFGYMGTFTSDRHAVMVTENGGTLIKTRTYSDSDNTQTTNVKVSLDKEGSAKVLLHRNYKGIEIENNNFDNCHLLSHSDQAKWFYDKHSWGNIHVDSLEISAPTSEVVPTGNMKVKLNIAKAASTSAGRLFYNPFVFTNINYIKLADKKRIAPIDIRYGYTQLDTINISLPEGYYKESGLEDVVLDSEYGSFSRTTTYSDRTAVIVRKFVLKKGTHPAAEYDQFRDFVKAVQKHDRAKMVLNGRS